MSGAVALLHPETDLKHDKTAGQRRNATLRTYGVTALLAGTNRKPIQPEESGTYQIQHDTALAKHVSVAASLSSQVHMNRLGAARLLNT